MENITCCFIGHRNIIETEKLKAQLDIIIEELIAEKRAETFLFGSKSRFNKLCYEIITEKKKKYPHIKRVYVRAEYSIIDENYKQYLSKRYEDTYYPERISGAGKSVYVERNFEMIQKSDICVIYYNENAAPKDRKSGTEIALNYANEKKKTVIRL